MKAITLRQPAGLANLILTNLGDPGALAPGAIRRSL